MLKVCLYNIISAQKLYYFKGLVLHKQAKGSLGHKQSQSLISPNIFLLLTEGIRIPTAQIQETSK